MPYFVGGVITKVVAVKDENQALVDPATISAKVTAPDGSNNLYTPTRLSLGMFKLRYSPTMPGRYSEDWSASA